jgi:hypothetical protein
MNPQTIRKLAKAIGWRARRTSHRSGRGGATWCLKTHESTRRYESDELIAYDVELNVVGCWCNDQASEQLVDILEDPSHPRYAAVWAWYDSQSEYAEYEAWNLASDKIFVPNELPPLEWDDATLARLVPEFGWHGILLRAVTRKRAQRSIDRLMSVLVDGTAVTPRRSRL